MEMDDQNQRAGQSLSSRLRACSRCLPVKVIALIVTLAGVAGAAGFLMSPLLRQDQSGEGASTPAAGLPLFEVPYPVPFIEIVLPSGFSEPKNSVARSEPRTTTRAADETSLSLMKRPRSAWKSFIGE